MDMISTRLKCAELAANSKEPPEKWVGIAAAIYEFVSGEKTEIDAAKLARVREAMI